MAPKLTKEARAQVDDVMAELQAKGLLQKAKPPSSSQAVAVEAPAPAVRKRKKSAPAPKPVVAAEPEPPLSDCSQASRPHAKKRKPATVPETTPEDQIPLAEKLTTPKKKKRDFRRGLAKNIGKCKGAE